MRTFSAPEVRLALAALGAIAAVTGFATAAENDDRWSSPVFTPIRAESGFNFHRETFLLPLTWSGLEDIEIVHEYLWRYNIRYSRKQIEEGLPLFIEDSQGEQHVWYTGGTLSHWNIDAITDYNHQLAKRFAKRIGLPFRARLKLFRFGQRLTDF